MEKALKKFEEKREQRRRSPMLAPVWYNKAINKYSTILLCNEGKNASRRDTGKGQKQ